MQPTQTGMDLIVQTSAGYLTDSVEGRGGKGLDDVKVEAERGLEILSQCHTQLISSVSYATLSGKTLLLWGRDKRAFCLQLGRGTW